MKKNNQQIINGFNFFNNYIICGGKYERKQYKPIGVRINWALRVFGLIWRGL